MPELDLSPSVLLPAAAAFLALIAYVPYVRDTLSGRTRPNRASWWIYTIVGTVGTASSLKAGTPWPVLITPAIYAVASLLVALLAIRRGEGGWTILDRCCLSTAALSILVWYQTGDPVLAVVMNSAADVAGSVPTMRKAWVAPLQENRVAWLLYLIANSLTLCALPVWTVAQALYPVALWFCALVIASGCWGSVWLGFAKGRHAADTGLP